MKPATVIMVVVLALDFAGLAQADTITVGLGPGYDFNTIQAGINAAGEGNTVIVAEGTYNENIHFNGINITLTSTNPNDPAVVAGTVIQGDGTTSVVTFSGGEDTSCELTGFTITGGYTSQYGGGIRGNGATAIIRNCNITENITDSHGGNPEAGGGLSGCDGPIINCIINDNRAGRHGGGLYKCNGVISNCIIKGNTAGLGGGLYDCDGTISNCMISGNSTSSSGGGLYRCDGTITDCIISTNSSDHSGAGLYRCSGRISNCIISNNRSDGWSGGGLTGCGPISNCIITGNVVEGNGGGLSLCTSPITSCIISNNSAGRNGGGVDGCYRSIGNCSIIGNLADANGGGLSDIHGQITNCTISDNNAGGDGGGIFSGIDSNATITNCILWGNSAIYGDEIYLLTYIGYVWGLPWEVEATSTMTVRYSDVQGGQSQVYIDPNSTLIWGQGNIDLDPCFVQPGYWDGNDTWVDGDYHLLPTSPCIDSGDPSYIPGPNEADLDGNPRLLDGDEDGIAVVDMGAYEYMPPIPAEVDITPDTLNLTSKGKWITCHIWLPEDYNVADIDPNSILLEDEIEAERVWVEGKILLVKFSRSEVQDILEAGEVELTVSGELIDGTVFEGTDTIRVIDKRSGKPAK